MLQKVYISNFTIIENLHINFSDKLNIITGETGAGKSILMNAINLVLGERVEGNVLLDITKKCIIECVFTNNHTNEIAQFFELTDVDNNTEIVVRREIAPNGKSRAFINDTPVNLQQLKELGSLLIDLHQQFDTLEVGKNDFQREVIDAMAGNATLLDIYTTDFINYTKSNQHLKELLQQQVDASALADYHQFLYDELNAIPLQENELENLEEELKLLSNAESIKQHLEQVYFEFEESDEPLIRKLKTVTQKLHGIEKYHPTITSITERLQVVLIELQDLASEINLVNNQILNDPEKLAAINEKMAIGYKLLKKHQLKTTNDLIQLKETLAKQLLQIVNIEEEITNLKNTTSILQQSCLATANKITANRKKALEPFVNKVNQLLTQVGMPNASIKVELVQVALNSFGNTNVVFYFDANNTNKFEPLLKVASGGELSRLMLCIKYLVAQELQLPTLIFDEIDTGISGEAAKQVGIIMKNLSEKHQVISITHQPQIAAKAHAHYFVYKAVGTSGNINTSIRLLNQEERITIIAKMLSGEKPSAAAIANAKELVAN